MDLMHDPEIKAFREVVRAFLAANAPEAVRRKVGEGGYLGRAEHTRWQRLLFDKGWAAPGWPVEHGGCGWPLGKQYVFEQEFALANAPRRFDWRTARQRRTQKSTARLPQSSSQARQRPAPPP